jgi:hypothetical protein
VDALEAFLRGGLERAGVPAGEEDLQLMRAIDALYGPALRELAQADLAAVDAELDLDPGRPPAGA